MILSRRQQHIIAQKKRKAMKMEKQRETERIRQHEATITQDKNILNQEKSKKTITSTSFTSSTDKGNANKNQSPHGGGELQLSQSQSLNNGTTNHSNPPKLRAKIKKIVKDVATGLRRRTNPEDDENQLDVKNDETVIDRKKDSPIENKIKSKTSQEDYIDTKEGKKEDTNTNEYEFSEYKYEYVFAGYGYGTSIDWWSLGIVTYEMLIGVPPFSDRAFDRTCYKILKKPINFGSHNGSLGIHPHAQRFLRGLLERNPKKRLGCRRNGRGYSSSSPRSPLFAVPLAPPQLTSLRESTNRGLCSSCSFVNSTIEKTANISKIAPNGTYINMNTNHAYQNIEQNHYESNSDMLKLNDDELKKKLHQSEENNAKQQSQLQEDRVCPNPSTSEKLSLSKSTPFSQFTRRLMKQKGVSKSTSKTDASTVMNERLNKTNQSSTQSSEQSSGILDSQSPCNNIHRENKGYVQNDPGDKEIIEDNCSGGDCNKSSLEQYQAKDSISTVSSTSKNISQPYQLDYRSNEGISITTPSSCSSSPVPFQYQFTPSSSSSSPAVYATNQMPPAHNQSPNRSISTSPLIFSHNRYQPNPHTDLSSCPSFSGSPIPISASQDASPLSQRYHNGSPHPYLHEAGGEGETTKRTPQKLPGSIVSPSPTNIEGSQCQSSSQVDFNNKQSQEGYRLNNAGNYDNETNGMKNPFPNFPFYQNFQSLYNGRNTYSNQLSTSSSRSKSSLKNSNMTSALSEMKNEPFFNGIDFDALYRKEIRPPYLPIRERSVSDVRNFDPEFTKLKVLDTPNAVSPLDQESDRAGASISTSQCGKNNHRTKDQNRKSYQLHHTGENSKGRRENKGIGEEKSQENQDVAETSKAKSTDILHFKNFTYTNFSSIPLD